MKLSTKGLDRADRETVFRVLTAALRHSRSEDDPGVEALEDLVVQWELFTYGPAGFRGDLESLSARRARRAEAAQWSTSELSR